MKRDWNLIRELMLVIEQDPQVINSFDGSYLRLETYCEWTGQKPSFVELHGKPNYVIEEIKKQLHNERGHIIKHHLDLMREEGLIKGDLNFGMPFQSNASFTLKGYDLLAFMKDQDIWLKIKTAMDTNNIPITYITIMELGKKITLAKIEELKF